MTGPRSPASCVRSSGFAQHAAAQPGCVRGSVMRRRGATHRRQRRRTTARIDAFARWSPSPHRSARPATDRFRQLTTTLSASLGIMEGEAKEVHREISDALETMQFQDRVSQIQAHVVGNLNALRETLEQKDVAVPDTEEWFRTMSRDFSTEEEFDNLRGDKSAGVAGRRHRCRGGRSSPSGWQRPPPRGGS